MNDMTPIQTTDTFALAALRALVRTHQDLQQARMAHANRVLQAALAAAGINPLAGFSEEEADKLGAEKRDALMEDYSAIIAAHNAEAAASLARKFTITPEQAATLAPLVKDKAITERIFNKLAAKVTVPNGLLCHFGQFTVCAAFADIIEAEAKAAKQVERTLPQLRIWTEFLECVRGCGPVIGASIISLIDITKAQYPSSLWAYAGLDVGSDGRGRSRRAEHLVERNYIDKDGKEATRKGITFNPDLKTRLFLLAESFIKAGGPYADVYRERKHRLESHPIYGVHNDGQEIEGKGKVSKMRRHRMAMRECQKRFLVDLYKAWRTIEGLPVAPEYSASKLGLTHGSAEKYAE